MINLAQFVEMSPEYVKDQDSERKFPGGINILQQDPTPATAKTGSKGAFVLSGILFLLLGAALITFAVYSNNIDNAMFQAAVTPVPTDTPIDPDPNAPVTCDNVPMSPGDECDHILTINGASTTSKYSYAEQKEYQSEQRIQKILSEREHQRMVQNERQKPIFSFFGCLSMVSCLAGLIVGMFGLTLFAKRRSQRKTQPPPSA